MIQILKWKDNHYLLLFDKFTRLRKRQPNKPPQISKHESGCDVISFYADSNFGTETGALWWKVYNHHVNLHLLSGNDVVSTHVFDGDTMLLTRRCNNVVFKLNDVATSFQLVFNVETTSVCPLGPYLLFFFFRIMCMVLNRGGEEGYNIKFFKKIDQNNFS